MQSKHGQGQGGVPVQGIEEDGDIHVLGVGGGSGLVSPSTQVFYICQQYSLVFVLDMSLNMRSVVSMMWYEDVTTEYQSSNLKSSNLMAQ